KLLHRLAPERRAVLIRLSVAWGSKKFEKDAAEAIRTLLARLKNESLQAEERSAAARELVGQRPRDRETVETVLEQITPPTSPELTTGLVESLRSSEAAEAGTLILERLPGLTPSAQATGLSIVLSRPEWTKALLERADKGKVQLADLSLDQKQALAAHPDRA